MRNPARAVTRASVRVEDLLRCLIIQSGNDAAITLAEGVAGSEDSFARLMNERAKVIGMEHSSFTNPWGRGDPGQRVTARDMAKLGVLARNGGRWDGRQVVPEAWLRRSTERPTTLGARGYGYFWWQQYFNVPGPDGANAAHAATRVDTYLASGNGGQKIFVVPSLEAVVVFTGGAYNVESATAAIMVRDLLPALLARRR